MEVDDPVCGMSFEAEKANASETYQGRSYFCSAQCAGIARAGRLKIPLGAFAAGLGDHKIVTTLCPGGKERMRRLMSVIAGGRIDLRPMVTHHFRLEQIEQAYDLFSHPARRRSQGRDHSVRGPRCSSTF